MGEMMENAYGGDWKGLSENIFSISRYQKSMSLERPKSPKIETFPKIIHFVMIPVTLP